MALFIGRLPSDVRNSDLEDVFSKYGRVSRLDIKRGASVRIMACPLQTGHSHDVNIFFPNQFNFAFVEFDDKRDAEDAMKATDGMTVSFIASFTGFLPSFSSLDYSAHLTQLEKFGARLVVEWSKGSSNRRSDSNECFSCGREGHFARDCPTPAG
ncbi:hypothetical protein HDU67_008502 [Dinochytrium kinnereticum]|nr:hypothetical protein HDU67_008502 [Dinochytrium kinnereticum]